MSLNWIVPGRRAVVTERLSYDAVLTAWHAALGEDALREKLVEWYAPLSKASDFDTSFGHVLAELDAWRARFSEPVRREVAMAPEHVNTVDHVGFHLRLWKGPYRVLKEHAAGHAFDVENPPNADAVPRELVEVGDLKLRFGAHREVLNADAEFVPGDVLEMPLFLFLRRCGVRRFLTLNFNPKGSPFTGDSVTENGGQSLGGALWLHDNLLAMRMQLLRNLARGAFYSLEPGYNPASDLLRKSNSANVEGETVYARGMVYGGRLGAASLARPDWGAFDNHWGRQPGDCPPTGATLAQFAADTRLTAAWTCTPTTKFVTSFLMQESWSGGSVNRAARSPDRPEFMTHARVRYFAERMYPGSGGRGAAREILFEQAGLTGTPGTEALQELALEELLGPRMALYVAAKAEAVREAREGSRGRRRRGQNQNREPRPDLVQDDDVDLLLMDEDVVGRLSEEDLELDWQTLASQKLTLELGRDELLDFFDGPLHAIALTKHEYLYVRIFKGEKFLEEASIPQPDGPPRPPRGGFFSTFDPLTGQDDYAAPDDRGDLFIFEATGRKHGTGDLSHPDRDESAAEDPTTTAFEVRPARWSRVEHGYVKLQGRRVMFGSGSAISARVTERGGGTRSNALVGIVSISDEQMRAVHEGQSSFPKVLLCRNQHRAWAHKSRHHDYPERAVPFSTLDESSTDSQYATMDAARDALNNRIERLEEALVRDLAERCPGKLWFEGRVTARLRNMSTELRGLRVEIARLRQVLAPRFLPRNRESHDTPVERRSRYREALEHMGSQAHQAQRTRDANRLEAINTSLSQQNFGTTRDTFKRELRRQGATRSEANAAWREELRDLHAERDRLEESLDDEVTQLNQNVQQRQELMRVMAIEDERARRREVRREELATGVRTHFQQFLQILRGTE